MLATPETGHLKELRFQDLVYDPAEDTFILLDALEQDQNLLSNCKLILEIG
jgi:release factor glutamine methyltransferase